MFIKVPSSRKFDEVSASLFYKIQPWKVVFLGMPETWTSYDLDSLSMPDAKVHKVFHNLAFRNQIKTVCSMEVWIR